MAGPRRRAREVALQILIQMDVRPELEGAEALRLYFEHLADDAETEGDDLPGPPPSTRALPDRSPPAFRTFAEELVLGVAARRAELDEMVQELSRNWRLERMALVERNVIRLALYEMKFTPAVPTNVALNEAVELAKRFGTAEGAAFVNGLLDRAATEFHIRR